MCKLPVASQESTKEIQSIYCTVAVSLSPAANATCCTKSLLQAAESLALTVLDSFSEFGPATDAILVSLMLRRRELPRKRPALLPCPATLSPFVLSSSSQAASPSLSPTISTSASESAKLSRLLLLLRVRSRPPPLMGRRVNFGFQTSSEATKEMLYDASMKECTLLNTRMVHRSGSHSTSAATRASSVALVSA